MTNRLNTLHRNLNFFFYKPERSSKHEPSWIVRLGGNGQMDSDASTLGVFKSKADAIEAMNVYNAAHPTSDVYAWFPERAGR